MEPSDKARVEQIAANFHDLTRRTNEALAQQTQLMTKMDAKLESLQRTASETSRAVIGDPTDNSDTGLKGDVKELREWQQKWSSSSSWFNRSVMNAILTSAIGALVAGFVVWMGLKR